MKKSFQNGKIIIVDYRRFNFLSFLFFYFAFVYKWITITGVTILLSLTVFLNLVAESMPTTSDAVPLIGIRD